MNNQKDEAIISFEGVSLGYGRRRVVSDVSFGILRNDFLGIVGPNGAGKTTLVRAILGILRPSAGRIVRRSNGNGTLRMGYVPQRDTLEPILPFTVADVVMMGRFRTMGLIRRPSKVDHEKVEEVIRHVDLQELATHPFGDLSGGQKQRTLIARALAAEPGVLVLDEPTNGMDLTSRTAILELIKRLHSEGDLTVIMVSHLLSDVANYVRRIAIVEESFFLVGTTGEVLTAANLTRLYDLPVYVERLHGNTIVVPGVRHE